MDIESFKKQIGYYGTDDDEEERKRKEEEERQKQLKQQQEQAQKKNSGVENLSNDQIRSSIAELTAGNSGEAKDPNEFVPTGKYATLLKNIKKNGVSYDNVTEDYINNFRNTANTFLDDAYKSYKNTGYSSAGKDAEEYSQRFRELNDQAGYIKAFLNANKDQIDPEEYNLMQEYMDTFDTKSRNVLKSFDSMSNYYKSFGSEDEYKKYDSGWMTDSDNEYYYTPEKRQERLNRYQDNLIKIANEDGSLSQEEAEALEMENNQYKRTQGVMDRYGLLEGKSDFEENKKPGKYNNPTQMDSTIHAMQQDQAPQYDADGNLLDAYGNPTTIEELNKEPVVEDKLGLYLGASDSEKHDALLNESNEDVYANTIKEGADSDWTELSQKEIDIYYYLLNTEGQEKAYKYLDDMKVELNRRSESKMEQSLENMTPGQSALMSVASVPANVIGGTVAWIGDKYDEATGKEYNPYSKAHSWANFSQKVRGETAKDIDEHFDNAALPGIGTTTGDVYQALMSGADSIVGASKAGRGFAAMMGLGASEQKARELYEMGASDEQIAKGATASGLFETAFEYISIDKLMKNSGSARAIKDVFKNFMKQGGIEASEEMATEFANIVYDTYNLRTQSEWEKLKKEGGYEQAFRESAQQVLNAGMGGFISGGATGAGYTGLSIRANNQQAQEQGRKIAENGDLQSYINHAEENGQDAERLKELAQKDPSQLTKKEAREIGNYAFDSEQAIMENAHKTEIKNRLEEKGMDASDEMVDRVYNEMHNDADIKIGNKEARDVANELMSDKSYNSTVQLRAAASDVAGLRVTLPSSTATTSSNEDKTSLFNRDAQADVEEAREKAKTKVSSDGVTKNAKTGKAVNIASVASVDGDNITFNVKDSDQTVSSQDLTYGSESQAMVYQNAVKKGMSAYTTNAIAYASESVDNMSTEEYLRGVNAAYTYGKNGFAINQMKEDGAQSVLTEAQQKWAYSLGRADARADINNRIASLKALSSNDTNAKGKVILPTGAKYENMTERQKASIATIGRVVADATHNNVILYESVDQDGKRVMSEDVGVLKKGQSAPNGYFDPKTGAIYIDINAGNKGEGTMAYTMAHELTHFVKEYSTDAYRKLSETLFKNYQQEGADVEKLTEKQMLKAKEAGREITAEEALEEVVADSMESMLTDQNLGERLQEIKNKDKGLWEKIKDYVHSLYTRLQAAYKGLDPNSEEGRFVKNMMKDVERIRDMFAEGIVEAGNTFEQISNTNSITVNDMMTAMEGAVDENGNELFQYRAMEHDIPEYKQMLKDHGVSDEKIEELFDVVENVMERVKEDLEILDYAYDEDIDDRSFEPVKPNSDPLYKYSVDYSTLCRKRILQQAVQVQLQQALDRAITREESIAIRNELMKIQKEGRQIEVACALCYVESARMKSPVQIQKFLDNRRDIIKEYFANKDKKETSRKKAEAEETKRKELSEEYRADIEEGTFNDPAGYTETKTGKKRWTALTKLPQFMRKAIRTAKKSVAQEYQPTAEQAELLDVADTLTTHDFTSPEGLSDLVKNYPDLFDAYTSYVRNATKSKGLENDTWWRKGDSLGKVSDNLIEAMNKENGLRSQSWSDFQVMHTLDYIAATIELSTRNAKMQAYTKVPDYVKLMGNTGQMINLSLIPTAQFNNSLEYDPVEGMPFETALELREQYPDTAGTICIGIDDQQIRMLLESSDIDYVIPYHHSGMSKVLRKAMNIPTWRSYQDFQSQKNVKRGEAQEYAKKRGVDLLSESDKKWHKHVDFSDWFDLKEAQSISKDFNSMDESELTEQEKDMKKRYGVMFGSYVAMQYMADNYLNECARRGVKPAFSDAKADFTGEENYWKLLIDRKMINNKTGEIIEQKAVQPNFNEDDILDILEDEVERYGTIKADQDYATKTVVEKFLSGQMNDEIKAINKITGAVTKSINNVAAVANMETENIKHSLRDSAGNTITQEQYFKDSKARDDNVNPTESEDIRFSDRETNATDTRTVLSNALLDTAKNETERNYIKKYQNNIRKINAEQKKLADLRRQISELSGVRREFNQSQNYEGEFTQDQKDRALELAMAKKDNADIAKLRALRDEATKTANRITTYDKKLLKIESMSSMKDLIQREKKVATDKANLAKRQAIRAYRQKRYESDLKKKVRRYVDDFRSRLQNPSERRYVPAPLVESVIDVFDSLDITGFNSQSKSAQKYFTAKEALAELKLQYDGLKDESYDFSSEFSEEFSKNIKWLMDTIDDTPLREMNGKQLEDVYYLLHDISAMVQDATKQIGTAESHTNYDVGQSIISEMNNIKEKGLRTKKVGDFFREWTLNPMRAVREMTAFDKNSRLYGLFEGINEGRIKADKFRMESEKKFDALRESEKDKKSFENAVEKATIKVKDKNGKDVSISKMQAMQALLTYERETQNKNRSHLDSPVKFTDVKYEVKGKYEDAFNNGHEVYVNDNFIQTVKDSLTEWDQRYLATAREFFNKDSKDAVNSVSMVTKHRLIATENAYVPYKVNSDYIQKESDNVSYNASLDKMGILQSVKTNASQQLIMRGLNVIVSDHIDSVAKVYGLTIPVRNFNKAFNMKQTKDDGGYSVKSAISDAWGVKSKDLLDQAVADVQTPRRGASNKLVSNVKNAFVTSTLASNISVWMKQAASYPTAGAHLSAGSLAKGLTSYQGTNKTKLYEEIDQYTPQHYMRRKGMSTQELGDLNQTHGWNTRLNAKLGKAAKFSPMNWIQAMDVATTAALWEASKAEVQKRNGSVDLEEVAKLYNTVLEDTQPMYDSLHRAEITKDAGLSNFIMFQTQPIQNSGILHEGAMRYNMAKQQYGKNSAQAKEALQGYKSAVKSQVASHLTFTAMTLLAAMAMHKVNPWRDKNKEFTWDGVSAEFLEEFMKNFGGAVVPVLGNYAISAVEKVFGMSSYDVLSDPAVDKVNTTLDMLSKVKDGKAEDRINAACEVASYFGVPAKNAYNIYNGLRLHAKDIANGEFGSFEAGQDLKVGDYVTRMYNHYTDGEIDDYDKALHDALSLNADEKKAKAAIKGAISRNIQKEFLKAYKKNDNETMTNIRKFLSATRLYEDPVKTTQDWIKTLKK